MQGGIKKPGIERESINIVRLVKRHEGELGHTIADRKGPEPSERRAIGQATVVQGLIKRPNVVRGAVGGGICHQFRPAGVTAYARARMKRPFSVTGRTPTFDHRGRRGALKGGAQVNPSGKGQRLQDIEGSNLYWSIAINFAAKGGKYLGISGSGENRGSLHSMVRQPRRSGDIEMRAPSRFVMSLAPPE